MAQVLGMRALSLTSARAEVMIPYGQDLIGDPETGVVHGGVISTMLDHVCGMMAFAVLGGKAAPATLDLRIDYYRPGTPGENLIAFAHPRMVTGPIAFIDGGVHNGEEDDLIARVRSAMMLPQGKKARAQ